METLVNTPEIMWASRRVHVPLPTRGKRKPLNQADGLIQPSSQSIEQMDVQLLRLVDIFPNAGQHNHLKKPLNYSRF
jgi:hypothetical protein